MAIPGVLALFLLLTSLTDLSRGLGVFDFKRVAQGVVLLLIFLIAGTRPGIRREFGRQARRMPRLAVVAVGLAMLLGLISALRHPHPAYGLAEIAILALSVCGIFVVAACRRIAGKRFDPLVLAVLVLLGLGVAAQEFSGLLANWALDREFSYQQMLIRFAHPRFYNQLQSWTLPLLAAIPFVFGSVSHRRGLAVVCIGLQWLILIASGGRGAFLAITISLVAIAFLVRKSRQGWFRLHVIGFILGAACYGAVVLAHSALAPAGGEFVQQSVARPLMHSTGRTHLWSLALKDAKSHPWLGAGPARFNCEGSARLPAHPHNFPLRLAAEWGIPAAILILAVCLWICLKLLRWLWSAQLAPTGPGRKQPEALDSLLVAAILAAALHACVSGVLMMPASQVAAVLVCGWLLGRQPSAGDARAQRRAAGLMACLVVALIAVALNVFNMNEIRHMEARVGALAAAGPAQPRYWQYGRSCRYEYAGGSEVMAGD